MAATPAKKFWINQSMAASFSQTFYILHRESLAFQLEAAIDTHVGSFSFQGRLETATDWHDIIPAVAVAAGAPVTILAELRDLLCEEVRVLYTMAGGTGALNGWWTSKAGS